MKQILVSILKTIAAMIVLAVSVDTLILFPKTVFTISVFLLIFTVVYNSERYKD